MKKKILSIILCTFVIFSFLGCKNKETNNDVNKKVEISKEENSKESEKKSKQKDETVDEKKEDKNSDVEDNENKYSNMTEEEILKETDKETKTIEVQKDKILTPESIQQLKDDVKKYDFKVSQETMDSWNDPKDIDEVGLTDEELEKINNEANKQWEE